MCECFIIGKGEVQCIQNQAKFFMVNEFLKDVEDYLVLTLEYGSFTNSDIFAIKRLHQQEDSPVSGYFHPIIRRYRGQKVVSEYHLNENFQNNWLKEDYMRGLKRYLEQTFASTLDTVTSVHRVVVPRPAPMGMTKLLAIDVCSLLPLREAPFCLVKSDFSFNLLSVFRVKLDSSEWIMKVTGVDTEKGILKLVVFSKNNVSTLGRISHDLQITPHGKEECLLQWTISYTNDLDPKIGDRMTAKRAEVMEFLSQDEARL